MTARHVGAVIPTSALYETTTANAYGLSQAYAALSQAGVAWPGGNPGGPPIAAPPIATPGSFFGLFPFPPGLPRRTHRRRPFGGRRRPPFGLVPPRRPAPLGRLVPVRR